MQRPLLQMLMLPVLEPQPCLLGTAIFLPLRTAAARMKNGICCKTGRVKTCTFANF